MGENTKSDGYIFTGADTPSRFSVKASTIDVYKRQEDTMGTRAAKAASTRAIFALTVSTAVTT